MKKSREVIQIKTVYSVSLYSECTVGNTRGFEQQDAFQIRSENSVKKHEVMKCSEFRIAATSLL